MVYSSCSFTLWTTYLNYTILLEATLRSIQPNSTISFFFILSLQCNVILSILYNTNNLPQLDKQPQCLSFIAPKSPSFILSLWFAFVSFMTCKCYSWLLWKHYIITDIWSNKLVVSPPDLDTNWLRNNKTIKGTLRGGM